MYSCGDTDIACWGNSVSAEALVPFMVKLKDFDAKPTKVTKMFLIHFSCFGWIPNLPSPPAKKTLNFEHLGAKSLWGTVVHAGT